MRYWPGREGQGEYELQPRLWRLELWVDLEDWTSDRSHSTAAQEPAEVVDAEYHEEQERLARTSLSRRGS